MTSDVATARPDATASERLSAAAGLAAARLGLRDDPESVGRDLHGLTEETLRLYEAYPLWPSALTDSGAPIELSIRLAASGEVALRCVFDVVDHRVTWAENWARILRYGARVAGGDSAPIAVWELCRSHSSGIPAHIPSKVIHGVAYGREGRRRGSLYFRTGWMPPDVLLAKFPAEIEGVNRLEEKYRCRVDPHVEVMGYDLEPGRSRRFKSYRWVGLDAGSPYRELVGDHPDLGVATATFDAFRNYVPAAEHHRCLFLQTSVDGGRARQRLFFFARAWGWTRAEEVDRLLGILQSDLGLDLDPLFLLARAARAEGLPLKPAMLAVGLEDGVPSATIYLWPAVPAARAGDDHAPALTAAPSRAEVAGRVGGRALSMNRAALSWLDAARSGDGSWNDSAAGLGDRFTTAYVETTTSILPGGEGGPEAMGDHRRAPSRTAPAAGEPAESLALSAAAVGSLAADPSELLPGDAPAEAEAVALLALVTACGDRIVPVLDGVLRVVGRQGPGGGWTSGGWSSDLYATWWALRALRVFQSAYEDSGLDETSVGRAARAAAAGALARGRTFLGSIVVPEDPFLLGLWLGSWSSAGGDPADAKVARVLAAIERLQGDDGRWYGSPGRLPAADELPATPRIDDGIVTTATVAGGLQAFLLTVGAA